jgi:hypothetical protein
VGVTAGSREVPGRKPVTRDNDDDDDDDDDYNNNNNLLEFSWFDLPINTGLSRYQPISI